MQRGTFRTEGGGSPPSPPEEPAGLFRAPALGRATWGPLSGSTFAKLYYD